MEKRECKTEDDKESEKRKGQQANWMNAVQFRSNQRTIFSTMSFFWKRAYRDRRRTLGNSRFMILRSTFNEKVLNEAKQTEASKKVLQLVEECKYSLTQVNGQRKFGPPLDWTGPPPGPGCEIFVGKMPRDLYEHDIYPVFGSVGKIYEIRLMMDFSGMNRGFCFIMYTKPEDASRAVKELDRYEIRPDRRVGVVASINYCRLFINQLPLDVTAEMVVKRIYEITDNVDKVAVYRSESSYYALISYKTHRGAAIARRRLVPEAATLFPGGRINVEWAHPEFSPSNMLEECGTCDQDGNVTLTKTFLRSTEQKRSSARRSSRKVNQQVTRATKENIAVSDTGKFHKSLQPARCVVRPKGQSSNFDRSTASPTNPSIFDQDHRATKNSNEQNQYDQRTSSASNYQDHRHSGRQNDEVIEDVDWKKETNNDASSSSKFEDVVCSSNEKNSCPLDSSKRLVDLRKSSFQLDRVLPNDFYQQRMFIEGSFDLGLHSRTPLNDQTTNGNLSNNCLVPNINPLGTMSFGQQNGRLCGTISGHCNIEQSTVTNNLIPNDPILLNDPTQREISLKLQAKALFQPHATEPWQNGYVPLNPVFQPNDSLRPNCNLIGPGNAHENDPFFYNPCLPGFLSSSSSFVDKPYQSYSFDTADDFHQNRTMINGNYMQDMYDHFAKMQISGYNQYSREQYKHYSYPNNNNINNININSGSNNHFLSSTVPMYPYQSLNQSLNQSFSLHQSNKKDFKQPAEVPFVKSSQGVSRTPRPILNTTYVKNGDN